MSWTDKNIDKAYKEGAEDASFEYKSDYWKEMEAMLPTKKSPDYFWFFTALLFVGMMVSLPFVETKTSLLTNNSITKKNFAKEQVRLVASNELSDKRNTRFKEQTSTGTFEAGQKKLNFQEEDVRMRGKNYFDAINNTELNFSEKQGVTEELNHRQSNVNTFLSPKNTTLEVFPVENIAASKDVEANKTSSFGAVQSREDILPIERSSFVSTSKNLEIDNLPVRYWGAIENELLAFEAYEPKLRSSIDFYAQVLGGVSQSLTVPSEGVSYSCGLGFGAQLHKGRFQLTTGVNALIFNHNALNLNRTAKVYGFGADVYQYDIDYKQIYSVEGLIEVGYRFGSHQFSIGVRPSFAYNSKVHLSETNLNWDESYVKENDTRFVYGYMDGINQFGLKTMLGYSFNISPSLTFGANVGVQLLSPVNPDFITGQTKQLPIDGQLYIRKSFSFRR